MEKILVPKGKRPLTVLRKLGEQTRNSWVFIHKNAVLKLMSTKYGIKFYGDKGCIEIFIKPTKKYPKESIVVKHIDSDWMVVVEKDPKSGEFKLLCGDSDEGFKIQMDE